jgi:hypothetical protein
MAARAAVIIIAGARFGMVDVIARTAATRQSSPEVDRRPDEIASLAVAMTVKEGLR